MSTDQNRADRNKIMGIRDILAGCMALSENHFAMLWEGTGKTPGLAYLIRNAGINPSDIRSPEHLITADVWRTVACAMDDWLRASTAPAVYRQQHWDCFVSCLRTLRDRYLPGQDLDPEEELRKPLLEDRVTVLVKSLHERDGISKSELADRLGISGRTLQSDLDRLTDPEKAPLRFAGQEVRLKVDIRQKHGPGQEKKYFSENTLHPLAMQLNLMQVGILLQSLCSYSETSSLCLDLALEIWVQLSDYARQRLKTVFSSGSRAFADFTDELDAELLEGHEFRFVTEQEMIDHGNVNLHDELIHALKLERPCTLKLREECGYRILENVRIHSPHSGDPNGAFRAVPAQKNDDFKNEILFTPDQLTNLTWC